MLEGEKNPCRRTKEGGQIQSVEIILKNHVLGCFIIQGLPFPPSCCVTQTLVTHSMRLEINFFLFFESIPLDLV